MHTTTPDFICKNISGVLRIIEQEQVLIVNIAYVPAQPLCGQCRLLLVSTVAGGDRIMGLGPVLPAEVEDPSEPKYFSPSTSSLILKFFLFHMVLEVAVAPYTYSKKTIHSRQGKRRQQGM